MKIIKIFLIVFIFTFITKTKAIKITNINEVNKIIREGFIEKIEGNSFLELDYRTIMSFTKNENIYKYYPRIKKVNDYYILTYHGNEYSASNTGGSIYYSLSKDLINWSDPVEIWRPFNYYNNQEQFDRTIFSNCDVLPLKNGKILIYAIYHSKHNYISNPYASGVVTRICSINNNQLECEAGNEIKEYNSNENLIGTYDTGSFIHTGPTWEPHAFYDNNGNIVMTFSSGEPINRIESFKHASGGVGTIVSKDNGNTWNEAKYSAFKFTGNYDNNGKNINYYTGQMAVTQLLNDGRYFSVYEMWSPSDSFDIPNGYSIEGSIFNKNYDFSIASNIKVSDVIVESLKDNPSNNDPRNQESFSGDDKPFFTITNPGAAPYIIQFPSGEVVVSFNRNNKQYLKLINSIENSSDENNILQTFDNGYWGSIDLVGPHSILSTFPNISNYSISYGIVHLNNLMISNYCDNIIIDGDNNDWKLVNDATFIGSDSQAQAIVRAAYNKNSIYFLVEILDKELVDDDIFNIKMKSLNNLYSIELNKNEMKMYDEDDNPIELNGRLKIINTDDVDKNGIIYEISIDKNNISISDYIYLYLSLQNKDNNTDIINDSLLNTDINDANTWLKMTFLEKKNEDTSNFIDDKNHDNDDNNKLIEENIDSVPNTLKRVSIILYITVSISIIGASILIYRVYFRKKN